MSPEEAARWKEAQQVLLRFLDQQERAGVDALLTASGEHVWYIRGWIAAIRSVRSRCLEADRVLREHAEHQRQGLPDAYEADLAVVPTPALGLRGEEPG